MVEMKHLAGMSLSIAACLVMLGPNLAHAKADQDAMASGAGTREAMQMVPAQVNLVKTLNAKNLHAGQDFQTKLDGSVQLKNGPELPRGTVLVGTVVADKMNGDGQNSTLELRFTQADLKGGKVVPIKATIVGVYPPAGGSMYGGAAQTPNYWTDKTLQVDQIGAIAGVDLHSKIAATNSGLFVSKKKDNMRFGEGSEFALAIAARNNAG
jgi:nitrogen fixation protein